MARHGMKHTKFYNKWESMKRRCSNPKTRGFKNYGGRGIVVCDSWAGFLPFKADMYESYLEHVSVHGQRDTTLDRIDFNKGYSKDNCRWATNKEQQNNRSTNAYIVDGKNIALDIAQKLGVTYSAVTHRLRRWPRSDVSSVAKHHKVSRVKPLVIELRSKGMTMREIAREVGVCRSTVFNIVSGKR